MIGKYKMVRIDQVDTEISHLQIYESITVPAELTPFLVSVVTKRQDTDTGL